MERLVIGVLLGAMLMQAQPQGTPAATPAERARQQRVKEQAIVMPPGATVEVRLMDGRKLRGRLGTVSDQGLAIRGVFDGKIEERTLEFTKIKSIRFYSAMMPRLLVTYVLTGVSMAVSIALAATR